MTERFVFADDGSGGVVGTLKTFGGLAAALWVFACTPRESPEVLTDLAAIEGVSLASPESDRLAKLSRDIRSVRAQLDRELRLRRKLTAYHQTAGLLLLRQRAFAGAASHFALALRETADNSLLFYYLGYALARQLPTYEGAEREKLFARAENAYRQALELNDRDSKALYALAALYTLEGERHRQAADLLDRYLESRQLTEGGRRKISDLRDMKALFLRARTAFVLGQTQKAREYYRWIREAAAEEQWKSQADKLLRELE